MFSKVFRTQDKASPVAKQAPPQPKPSPPAAPSIALTSPCLCQTTASTVVVRIVVEITDLAVPESKKKNAYAKVKFARAAASSRAVRGDAIGDDIHKTNHLLVDSGTFHSDHASFCLDGIPLQDLEDRNGLLFKVKSGNTGSLSLFGKNAGASELGHVSVTPSQLLSGNPLTLPLCHGNNKAAGTISIRCRPAEPSDVLYYKQWNMGYFQEYEKMAPNNTTKPIPENIQASVERESLDEGLTVDTTVDMSAPNSPERGDQPPSPPQTKRLIPTGEDPYKDSEEDELGGMFCGHSQDCFAGNCVVS